MHKIPKIGVELSSGQGHSSRGFPGVRKPPEILCLVFVLLIPTYRTYHFSNFRNRGWGSYISIRL